MAFKLVMFDLRVKMLKELCGPISRCGLSSVCASTQVQFSRVVSTGTPHGPPHSRIGCCAVLFRAATTRARRPRRCRVYERYALSYASLAEKTASTATLNSYPVLSAACVEAYL